MAKAHTQVETARSATPLRSATAATTWRDGLPTLTSPNLTLREPAMSDAIALLTSLSSDAPSRFLPGHAPTSVAAMEAFIAALQSERRAGVLACWVIVPADSGIPVGLIGVRALDSTFSLVEGEGVVAEEFRGSPIFQTAGRMLLACLFGRLGVHRAEFRLGVTNGRANGAMRKLGATQEGVLRRALLTDGEYRDQVLWSILASDWNASVEVATGSIH